MKIGYCRVSTKEQDTLLQRDALERYGCGRIFEDKVSGAQSEREGLQRALDAIGPDDELVVWRLDRAGRSLTHLIELAERLKAKGGHLSSITERIDTQSAGGQLVFHVFAALAQFERCLIRERTNAGLEAARVRGRVGGRPRCLDEVLAATARELHSSGRHSISEICRMCGGISRQTLYNSLRKSAKNDLKLV